MKISFAVQTKHIFNKNLYSFYKKHVRKLPWREAPNGYFILISEFMLQQTQVNRVIPFFQNFIAMFPTLSNLAQASLEQVLVLWNGLGYNRRGKYLLDAAKEIYYTYGNNIPPNYNDLIKIKGIGPYTAKAIITYTYNFTNIFIETNIRTVFLILFKKHFTARAEKISEKEFEYLVSYYCDRKNPRQWYYAMMDFGSFLKNKHRNKHIQKSKAFTHQSKFENSFRQLRGKILKKLLHAENPISRDTLHNLFIDERLNTALVSLINDKLIFFNDHSQTYSIMK